METVEGTRKVSASGDSHYCNGHCVNGKGSWVDV